MASPERDVVGHLILALRRRLLLHEPLFAVAAHQGAVHLGVHPTDPATRSADDVVAEPMTRPASCCDACGYALRGVRRVGLLVEGRLVLDAHLCPGCEDDARTRLRDLIEGDRVLRVTRR